MNCALHFAETVYGPDTTGDGGEGSRLMTVKSERADTAQPFRRESAMPVPAGWRT